MANLTYLYSLLGFVPIFAVLIWWILRRRRLLRRRNEPLEYGFGSDDMPLVCQTENCIKIPEQAWNPPSSPPPNYPPPSSPPPNRPLPPKPRPDIHVAIMGGDVNTWIENRGLESGKKMQEQDFSYTPHRARKMCSLNDYDACLILPGMAAQDERKVELFQGPKALVGTDPTSEDIMKYGAQPVFVNPFQDLMKAIALRESQKMW